MTHAPYLMTLEEIAHLLRYETAKNPTECARKWLRRAGVPLLGRKRKLAYRHDVIDALHARQPLRVVRRSA